MTTRTIIFAIFAFTLNFLPATSIMAQSTLAAILYNKDLPQSILDKKAMEGEQAARLFFTVLQKGDSKSLDAFLAPKSVYLDIVAKYPYEQEAKREQAKKEVEANHDKLMGELHQNFQEIRDDAKKMGINIADLEVSQVKMVIKSHETMRGGRVTLELKDKNGKLFYLRLNSFYQFGEQWYLMGKGKWKLVNSDFVTPSPSLQPAKQ